MLLKKLVLVITIIYSVSCYSQTIGELPAVSDSDIPGAMISPARSFTGASLFGYMNGGAELYREYGCESASITEIQYKGGNYKTEVFRMTDPEAAFGIFSVSKYRCMGYPDLHAFTCQTKYQLQISRGPYYISIINRNGTASDSAVMLQIGKILTDKIPEPEADLSVFLPGTDKNSIKDGCFLAKGRLGIVNGSPEMEDFFNSVSGFIAVILRQPGKTIVSVRFVDEDSFMKFTALHKWETQKLEGSGFQSTAGENVRIIGDKHLLVEIRN